MGDMDQGLKRLFQFRPADIMTFANPGLRYVGTMPTDVATEPHLMLDTLFEARYHQHPCLANIEGQAEVEKEVPERCRIYAARAKAIYHLDMFSIILWLKNSQRRRVPTSPHVVKVGEAILGTWHFSSIEVYRLDARVIISTGALGLLPLIPFMDGADMAAIERTASVVKEQATDQETFVTLETLLAVFSSIFHDKDNVIRMFRRLTMSTELLEQSSLYREWVREGQEKGLQQGLQQGLRLGLMRALVKRFGVLPTDLIAAIDAADDEVLDTVMLQLGVVSMEQLRGLLGLNG